MVKQMLITKKKLNLILIAVWIAALLALATMWISAEREEVRELPFSLQIESNGMTETVSIWKGEEELFYAFLPGYADLSRTGIHLHTNRPVSIDGVRLTEGMPCGAFQTDTLYELTCSVTQRS